MSKSQGAHQQATSQPKSFSHYAPEILFELALTGVVFLPSFYFLVPAFEYAIDQTVYGNGTIHDTLTLVAAWFMWTVLTGVLLFGVQLILRPCKQYLSQKFSSRT